MRRALCLLLLLTGLAACTPGDPRYPIADLQRLPQDPALWLDPATADLPLLSTAEQQAQAERARRRFFAPWQDDFPRKSREEAGWFFAWAADRTLYGENLRPLPAVWFEALRQQAALADYPSLARRAVTVRATPFRALPTTLPAFRDPDRAGEGYPFDYLQMAVAPLGTPLLITHRSRDGGWLFAESGRTAGWLRAEDVAWIDDAAPPEPVERPLAVLLRDGPVLDGAGNPHGPGRLGTLLPLLSATADGVRVLVPTADADGRAVWREALLPPEQAAPWPLPYTPRQAAALAAPLMGRPYGWGGLYGLRDCSTTVRDLLLPFGLWLPRNSSQQAAAGTFIDLAGLERREKIQRILAEGRPWRTLLWLPGHILLYLGQRDGEPVALHALWGVRTRNLWNKEGRRLVGATVITSLEPGRELWALDRSGGLLLQSIQGMVLLPAVTGGRD